MAKRQKDLPKVHPELQGFDIRINAFGEIERTMPIEQVIRFLNKEVVDKKLCERFGYKSDDDDHSVHLLYNNPI